MSDENRAKKREALPRRVLLLLTSRSYRSIAFIEAAARLDIEVVKAVNMEEHLAEYWNFPLGLNYNDLKSATASIVNYAAEHPLGAVLAVDDSGTLLAALANEAMNLPHNSPEAATAARDKFQMRQLLKTSSVNSPSYELVKVPRELQETLLREIAQSTSYPCVVKPVSLSGSRGVIRADNQDEFVSAARRLIRILSALNPGADSVSFLVEEFIPGYEVALEGIMDGGQLTVLALFDKPDPLDGPYFEETIYVTPSRLPLDIQESVVSCAAAAAEALGLREGSVHAELRINDKGPWLIEMAGRSIGGLCSNTLRFAAENTLEELVLRQTFGMEFASLKREDKASGVMMLPIPGAGLLKRVDGCEEAESVPLVEKVEITARLNYSLKPLPDGDSYLGFIFARGETPDRVENALRVAHQKLKFTIAPELPLLIRSV